MKISIRARLQTLRARLQGTFGSPDVLEREMDAEMRFHLEMATQRNIANGMKPREARRQAMIAFGGIESMKEHGREAQRMRWFENIGTDMRFAARSLRSSPAFTTAALLTISVAIAANVSVFSIVNAVLLRPLPFPRPQDVVYVGWDWGKGNLNQTATLFQYEFMRRNSKAFDGVATFRTDDVVFGSAGSRDQVHGMRVSADFFKVVGIKPDKGRVFDDQETRTEGSPVVIISDALWRTKLGGDPQIIGRTIALDGTPRTVVGVMPPTFSFPAEPTNTDYFTPYVPVVDQTRFIESMLYDVTPGDPMTFCAVITLLCAVGGIAGLIPARRASRIDPGIALRAEHS